MCCGQSHRCYAQLYKAAELVLHQLQQTRDGLASLFASVPCDAGQALVPPGWCQAGYAPIVLGASTTMWGGERERD